ncbi:MAG: GIY-YIG nuclease family protein [Candidatus Thorarchaeota archaeon]|nr:GIY-YIG nuclease family protein [Candidatus Thorarchaeota archaeon]
MRGVYVLIVDVPKKIEARVGAMGGLSFDRGEWAYVGSAMGTGSTSIENRLKRHFSENKTVHWHIDYLLQAGGRARFAIWSQSEINRECDVAHALGEHILFEPGPAGFGASDCTRHCGTHMFHFTGGKDLEQQVRGVMIGLGLKPEVMRPR